MEKFAIPFTMIKAEPEFPSKRTKDLNTTSNRLENSVPDPYAVVAAKVQVTLFGISYSGTSLKDTSEVRTPWLMRILYIIILLLE